MAISVPFDQASATETVAERAPAWSAQGVRVDGTDVEAVADAFGQAVGRARQGGGPTLIEAMCYRFRGHFEGDADTYRSEEEKELRRGADPVELTAHRLVESGVVTGAQVDAVRKSVRSAMADLLASVRADSAPDPALAMHHVFVGEA